MSKRISKHLTPSTAIALLALVFAITGGAFAATGGSGGPTGQSSAIGEHATLTASVAKAKPKAKTGPRGPAGPKGATGATGAAGATGPAGAKGETGGQGPEGKAGANGQSVTSAESASAIEGHCTGTGTAGKGGSKFEVEGKKTYACNGKEGSPWTAGGTLPSGATETGVWASGPVAPEAVHDGLIYVPISFSIILAQAPKAVHFINTAGEEEVWNEQKEIYEGKPSTECIGTTEAPTAPRGGLCIYVGHIENASPGYEEFVNAPAKLSAGNGAGTAGAVLRLGPKAANVFAAGTWAVTAE